MLQVNHVEIRHFHICNGLGGGAAGFNRGQARVGHMQANFRCIGGVDVDPACVRDFTRKAGVPGTQLDLFTAEQYRAFHGRDPEPGWREATPDDLRRAAGGERPHIVFTSSPCKGFSGLLSEAMSKSAKYQALNGLAERSIWLTLEAWSDDPPEFILFENVPRIARRGRALLDRIVRMLRAYGYAVVETSHDCGEIGGLAQSRKRFLLVARHMAKVPPFLYEPPKRRLLGVGEVLEKLPLPGLPLAGPMHRIPSLQWRTWVRLAFVEAGHDWRSLNRLRVEDGFLADFGILPVGSWRDDILGVLPWSATAPTVTGNAGPTTGRFSVADPREFAERRRCNLGVVDWQEPCGTVTGDARPSKGAFSVADPRRADGRAEYGQYGVKRWDEVGQTVIGKAAVGAGNFSVADPRPPRFGEKTHLNVYRIVPWTSPAGTVTGANHVSGADPCVADPRPPGGSHTSKYRVTTYDEPAGTVISASTTGQGAFALADPRYAWGEGTHQNKMAVIGYDQPAKTITGSDRVGSGALSVADPRAAGLHHGVYGVGSWDDPAGTVTGSSRPVNGTFAVADPRGGEDSPDIGYVDAPTTLPAPEDRLVAVIRALDGTWHRPFTTLELAALQGLVDPDQPLVLDGASDSGWRERIGNAVPPAAAEAIASEMGRTLLLAWTGQTFALGSTPIWVQPLAVALSVDTTLQSNLDAC